MLLFKHEARTYAADGRLFHKYLTFEGKIRAD